MSIDPLAAAVTAIQLVWQASQNLDLLDETRGAVRSRIERIKRILQSAEVQAASVKSANQLAIDGINGVVERLSAKLDKIAKRPRALQFIRADNDLGKLQKMLAELDGCIKELLVELGLKGSVAIQEIQEGMQDMGQELVALMHQSEAILQSVRETNSAAVTAKQVEDIIRKYMPGNVAGSDQHAWLLQQLQDEVKGMRAKKTELARDFERLYNVLVQHPSEQQQASEQQQPSRQQQPQQPPSEQEQLRRQESASSAKPPDALCCPISKELFCDPVVLVDSGRTYERAYIARWLQQNQRLRRPATDPCTRQVLATTTLVPNVGMFNQARAWRERHGRQAPAPPSDAAVARWVADATQRDDALVLTHNAHLQAGIAQAATQQAQPPPTSAGMEQVDSLQARSRVSQVRNHELQAAIDAKALLSKTNPLLPKGVDPACQNDIPSLVRLLDSADAAVQRWAAEALGTLAKGNAACRASIAAAGAISLLVRLLDGADAEVQAQAAYALGELAIDSTANKVFIFSAGAIPPLARLLGSANAEVQSWAARALGLLAYIKAYQSSIKTEGGINPLVHLLDSTDVEVQRWAAFALGRLVTELWEYNPYVSSLIQSLVRLLGSENAQVQRCAANAMGKLAVQGSTYRNKFITAGAAQLLARLLDSVDAQVQRNALQTLINLADANTANLIAADAIPPLVRLLDSANAQVQVQAAWALGKLAKGNAACQASIAAADAIPPLVRLLDSANAQAQDQAAWALGNLAEGNAACQASIAAADAIPPLVRLLGKPDTKFPAKTALRNLAHDNLDNKAAIERCKRDNRSCRLM